MDLQYVPCLGYCIVLSRVCLRDLLILGTFILLPHDCTPNTKCHSWNELYLAELLISSLLYNMLNQPQFIELLLCKYFIYSLISLSCLSVFQYLNGYQFVVRDLNDVNVKTVAADKGLFLCWLWVYLQIILKKNMDQIRNTIMQHEALFKEQVWS